MQLQDYIQYYIGCRCFNTWFPEDHPEYNRDWCLKSYRSSGVNPFGLETENEEYITSTDSIKPILRRLEDMTEEDKTEIARLYGWFEGKKIINEHHLNVAHDALKELAYDSLVNADHNDGDRLGPKAYFTILPYLLRQHFDLFNLIDNGLAVDAKTIEK